MREIKLRAWDKKLSVMWEQISLQKLLRYLFFESMPNATAYEEIKDHFNDIIWLQFTGLLDKSGIEIYEGDIIQSKSEIVNLMTNENTGKFKIENYEVRWQEDEGRWGRWKNNKFELLVGLDKSHLLKWYEVIGNIYTYGGEGWIPEHGSNMQKKAR